MTDRELLELAAKAAGISFDEKEKSKFGLWVIAGIEPSEYTRRRWNPITDDGDALRLAVKLHISIMSNETNSWVATGMHQIVRAEEPHDGADPYAASRRAIVRAAAEVGKAMP